MVILATYTLVIIYAYHRTKGKIPCQLVFGRDMIFPINHIADWKYMCKRKQSQIEKDVIREISTRTNHDYRVGDQVIIGRKHRLNVKPHSKAHLKNFKRGKTDLSPYK